MSKLTFTTPCIFLFLCILFYLPTIPVVCSNNDTDFQALVAFKNAIESDPMGALFSWNQTVHFCSWQGVSCSRRHKDRAVSIDLMSRGLVGSISPHLGNLSFLRSINLKNNTFSGQIPNEIGRLRRLEIVEFSNNSLSGEVPKNISQCTNIIWINLVDNELTGIIPHELTSLMKLETLGLGSNQLSGSIPPSIGNVTRLRQLSLKTCGMQGEIPTSIVELKSLQYLILQGNNLTGNIPLGLFNISTLSVIGVAENRLEGTIPSDVGSTISRLTRLSLWDNLLTGEIPTSLSNISSLIELLLHDNNFRGRVKIDFNRLSALMYLDLGSNILEGDLNFISSMTNCTQLKHLRIYSNQLSGLLPHSIANLSSTLRVFIIGRNPLYGRIPPGMFGGLIGLISCIISDTYLDGPLPSDIGKLNKVEGLSLRGNQFSSNIPFSLGNLTSVIYLDMEQNNFTGSIPQSLGNCTHMLQIALSDNNLNGPIPSQLLVSNLIFFDLSHNVLTGSIPVEVNSLINLQGLDLSYNSLSGYVSNSLSSCVRLEEIYLQSNSFHGELHDELRTLRGLRRVDFSQNNLTGTIPSFFGELDLLYLNLSFNRLEGEIPNSGVFLNKSAVSLEGNKGLCGGNPSLNFTPCARENPKKKHFHLIFKVLIGVVGAIALVCCCIVTYKKVTSKDARTSNMDLLEGGYLRLSYADLQKFTCGFTESNLLGAGRFGSVYKGILQDMQTSVAVKVLHLNVKGASKSFISECKVLRNIRHRNLVKILSVCSSIDFQENDFMALVYEFMANGNLDELLHQKPGNGSETLSLRQRLDIAIDIALALEYLHFGTDSTIVHGDLKPSNVMVDEDMIAHVGDFGLAKIISNISSTNESSSIGIRGTIGYIPPEYGLSGVVSTQGDVYSYGILLLEMFTGIRPTEEGFKDSWALPDFVRNALPSQVMDVLDPVIVQEHNHVECMECVVSIFEIGLACSVKLPRERMAMTDVVNQLKKVSQTLAQSRTTH